MAVKYEEEEKPEVQLTSMMDCIFLMLIFFLVSSQLKKMMDCIFLMLIFFLVSSQLKKIEKEIPIELPVSNVARDVKATPDLVTVSVDSKGDLYVNSKPVGPAGLRSALQAAVAEKPDRRIRIAGDIFAPFRSIVQVLDVCQQERLNVVGIHTADGLKK